MTQPQQLTEQHWLLLERTLGIERHAWPIGGFSELSEAELAKVISAAMAEGERWREESERIGTHGPGCADWGPRHYECLRAELSALRERMAEAEKVIERLGTTAALLQANAEGCAVNHHGEDFHLHGMPGWLSDTAKDIVRARQFTEQKETGR